MNKREPLINFRGIVSKFHFQLVTLSCPWGGMCDVACVQILTIKHCARRMFDLLVNR